MYNQFSGNFDDEILVVKILASDLKNLNMKINMKNNSIKDRYKLLSCSQSDDTIAYLTFVKK